MSTYGSPVATNFSPYHGGSQPPAPPARPVVLTAAGAIALLVAALNIVCAILVIAGVDDLTRDQIATNTTFGGDPIDPALVDMSSERADGLRVLYSILAYSMIFWALALVTLALFALRGGRTTRVLATVLLVVTALFKGLDTVMSMPVPAVAIDVLVGVLAPVAIVLFFLPAANAYGRRRRAARIGAGAGR